MPWPTTCLRIALLHPQSDRLTMPFTLSNPATLSDQDLDQLTDVLLDCVEGGASVGFMLPLARDHALAFWRRIALDVAAGRRAILLARDTSAADRIRGTVQLILEQPDNQPHRADLVKMLVHSSARRRGLGATLIRAAESAALARQKTLVVLDAVTDGDAARLYQSLGWIPAGTIPNFALFPRGGLCSTTYFYRELTT